jgi:hypothetical protein
MVKRNNTTARAINPTSALDRRSASSLGLACSTSPTIRAAEMAMRMRYRFQCFFPPLIQIPF